MGRELPICRKDFTNSVLHNHLCYLVMTSIKTKVMTMMRFELLAPGPGAQGAANACSMALPRCSCRLTGMHQIFEVEGLDAKLDPNIFFFIAEGWNASR